MDFLLFVLQQIIHGTAPWQIPWLNKTKPEVIRAYYIIIRLGAISIAECQTGRL
jgi:hypothetical protein